ncbi:hypothetical protein [Zavarzinia sp. CC-PAN008]|uniref:hypothetical protein n=1 Tax=Zavarzinia sp. CC-PAN008 TaxID=3243332 RepID=UPI003F74417B
MLSRLFPAPRPSLIGRTGVERPNPGRGPQFGVVSRGLARYQRFPLIAERSDARRLGALDLQITRWSPFADAGRHIHLWPDHAGVWIWDRTALAQGLVAFRDLRDAPIVPETAVQPPGQDGLRLVAGIEGVEGQYWQDGELLASRWWPAAPDTTAWLAFQRGAGLAPEAMRPDLPPTFALPLLDRPWTQARAAGPAESGVQRVARFAAIAGLGVLLVVAWLAGGLLSRQADVAAVEAHIADLEQRAGPLLAAREQTFANDDVLALLAALDPPPPLALLAELMTRLPDQGAVLSSWRLQNGEVEVLIQASQMPDAAAYVGALEGAEAFERVVAERGDLDNQIRLRMTVVPTWRPS